MTKLTTTLRRVRGRVREVTAFSASYRKFAKYKGGVRRFGLDTPFPILEVLEVCGLDEALWAMQTVMEEPEGRRISRIFACDCAEHVLPLFETAYPNDRRIRLAIEVARRPVRPQGEGGGKE